jgi:undecaprenyl diphosphate synthase
MKSTTNSKLHVAVIMDGNGRWAEARGLPRIAGHHAGAESVRRVVEASPALSIGVLTLYAFSSDNWKRPSDEVAVLLKLLEDYLNREREECLMNGVRIRAIGRRDRLPDSVRRAMERTEQETAAGRELEVRLAVDYSSRDAIVAAAARSAATREDFTKTLGPEVDLLIRTGGEQRLSDFLLWECAYSELYFTPCMWPDFGADELAAAVRDFNARDRRFGEVGQAPLHAHPGVCATTLELKLPGAPTLSG